MSETKNKTWIWILGGMVLGAILGLSLPKESPITAEVLPWIALPGNIFLALLQMIMIPLVLSSVALGIARQKGGTGLGRLFIVSIGYFTSTTVVAISIGVILALAIHPGKYVDLNLIQEKIVTSNTLEATKDLRQSIPESTTSEIAKIPTQVLDVFPRNPIQSLNQASMLSIVIFSLLLGLALTQIKGNREKPLVDLLDSLQEYSMVVVAWALRIAPLAVFGLMAQAMSQVGLDLLAGLLFYILTVLLGLGSVLVFYLMLGFFLGRMNPIFFITRVKELQLLAFSASSSSAVLPISLKTSIEKLKVRERIADFVIPLGATINMDGTAIYQSIATIFLAQIYGIDLSNGQLIGLIATVTGASIGTAATPGVGIVILSGILATVGIPLEGIAIIFGVDRFLDMCRTAVNVTGDVVASKVIDRIVKG